MEKSIFNIHTHHKVLDPKLALFLWEAQGTEQSLLATESSGFVPTNVSPG